MGAQGKHDNSPNSKQEIPPAEWAAAGVGLMIVLAILAFLLMKAVQDPASPPDISIKVVGVEAQQGKYLVRLQVFNNGGSTAAQLAVEGTVAPQNGEMQRSQLTLDYVPAHSKRGAGLFFTTDPMKARLEVRAIGYQTP